MENILAYKHSILILYETLYCSGSVEFVSELIKKIKKIDDNDPESELKNKVRSYMTFLVMGNFIHIRHGKVIYDKKNIQDFFELMESQWDKFENESNIDYNHFWYSYLIEYSEKWITTLSELK